jgi:hypothetical protein
MLAMMTPNEVQNAARRFRERYVLDWQKWSACFRGIATPDTAHEFAKTLRKWQAIRGKKGRRLRRTRIEADHEPPFMEEVMKEALTVLSQLGGVTIRDFLHSPPNLREGFSELWLVMRQLATTDDAPVVAISKATLLLTLGRIGPAFDSTVCRCLRISPPNCSESWLTALVRVAEDLAAFESRYGIRIETLVSARCPVAAGRAYDMVTGPGTGS